MAYENLADKIHRVKFREWLKLEELFDKITKAAEELDNAFPELVYEYLSSALSIEKNTLQTLPWHECIGLLTQTYSVNLPKSNLPLITSTKRKEKYEDPPWNYDGRRWYLYSHIIADAYGWTPEYISGMDTDDALSYIQEILVEEQLQKEFEWAMSENAFSYDKASKQSRFHPLPRPGWMEVTTKRETKKIKIPKGLMPVGNIVKIGIENEGTSAKAAKSRRSMEGL